MHASIGFGSSTAVHIDHQEQVNKGCLATATWYQLTLLTNDAFFFFTHIIFSSDS